MPDEGVEQQHELQERCPLYVVMTRAGDELTMCGFEAASPYST